jgi:hypothetical protein|tara:strand:+ start:221 stop:484 length:264 start_codon:yes stop_codon:yes gene_type:complete
LIEGKKASKRREMLHLVFRVPYPNYKLETCHLLEIKSLQKRDTNTTRRAFAAFSVFAVTLLLLLKARRRVDHTLSLRAFLCCWIIEE